MTQDRQSELHKLRDQTFDILVIGGGITGAGVLLDAASRGLRTALVEKDDFSSGTSSKSSKLVHGGLRYLQQKEFKLVYEALHERQRLLKNAPHLVTLLPFLIPLFGRNGVINKTVARTYSTALWLYDITGGWRVGKRHKKLKREEAIELFPTLNSQRLVSSWLYYDATADDSRLVLSLIRRAVHDFDALALNHLGVKKLLVDDSKTVCGVELVDGSVVKARCVVNATGVWAEQVEALDGDVDPNRIRIRPAKGVHITLPHHLVPIKVAGVLPVPKDKRSIFAVPWGDFTYLGTTDTDYEGPLDNPTCTSDDIEYILSAVNAASAQKVTAHDITGTWAGLRPLISTANNSRTADLSRKHKVLVSNNKLITVTGGKLTTYRKMAEETVDTALKLLGQKQKTKSCQTKSLPLYGAYGLADLIDEGAASRHEIDEEVLKHLVSRHGSDARTVINLTKQRPELLQRVHPALPYLRAEIVHAARSEMATCGIDVVARRTRALILDAKATHESASVVSQLIGDELGWNAEDIENDAQAIRGEASRQLARNLD